MGLELFPISFKEACEFVNTHHRHLKAPQGHKFSISCGKDGQRVGVVIVGRPVSRHEDDGLTLQVTRLCTDGTKNACSFLLAAAWRVTKNLGYKGLLDYVMKSEKGVSLWAVNWKYIGEAGGGDWNVPSRPRNYNGPQQKKLKFKKTVYRNDK